MSSTANLFFYLKLTKVELNSDTKAFTEGSKITDLLLVYGSRYARDLVCITSETIIAIFNWPIHKSFTLYSTEKNFVQWSHTGLLTGSISGSVGHCL